MTVVIFSLTDFLTDWLSFCLQEQSNKCQKVMILLT